jgi:hypothetical protein
MAGNDTTGKFFEALNEGSDALIDAVRAANDRGHRVSTALIEEAQEGQRETAKLAKQWAEAPFNVFGLYSSLVESTTRAQGRALDATRQWFEELADMEKETRETMKRVVSANRTAGAATVELARGLFSRAGEAVQSAAEGNGRKTVREQAKTSRALVSESEASSDS